MIIVNGSFVSIRPLSDFHLFETLKEKRSLISFNLEITARCNNNCRHCYINLPSTDLDAKAGELSFEEIKGIADERMVIHQRCMHEHD